MDEEREEPRYPILLKVGEAETIALPIPPWSQIRIEMEPTEDGKSFTATIRMEP